MKKLALLFTVVLVCFGVSANAQEWVPLFFDEIDLHDPAQFDQELVSQAKEAPLVG